MINQTVNNAKNSPVPDPIQESIRFMDAVDMLSILSQKPRTQCIRKMRWIPGEYKRNSEIMRRVGVQRLTDLTDTTELRSRRIEALRNIQKLTGKPVMECISKITTRTKKTKNGNGKHYPKPDSSPDYSFMPTCFKLNGRGASLHLVQIDNRKQSGENIKDILDSLGMPTEIYRTLKRYRKYLPLAGNQLTLNLNGTINETIKKAAEKDLRQSSRLRGLPQNGKSHR
jgi:hypothetical protein